MQLTNLGRFVWVSLLNGTSAFCSRLRERRSEEKHTYNRQRHDHARCTCLHSCLQNTVLIKCGVCSYPHCVITDAHAPQWLKKKIDSRHVVTHNHNISSCFSCLHVFIFSFFIKIFHFFIFSFLHLWHVLHILNVSSGSPRRDLSKVSSASGCEGSPQGP